MTNYETLPGRSRENAKLALEKAVENGFEPEEVRTTRDGYLIPTKDEPETKAAKADEKKSTTKRGASKKE